MELQNINLDYQNPIFSSFYEDKVYLLVEELIMQEFKTSCERDYLITIEKLVIQLTYDQNLSEPRIVFNAASENTLIVTMSDLQSNFPATYNQFLLLQTNVIDQITAQTA